MSIIGNPIMVGGGGKNNSSIIITGLKSTDTVTCTKDGKSYIATWDDTSQYWEIVGLPLGTFTVEAIRGMVTTTETVLIDIAGVYEIEMSFILWLYKEGNEYEDITGGLVASSLPAQAAITKYKNSIYVHGAVSDNAYASIIGTANKINIDKYSTIYFDLSCSKYDSGSWLDVGMAPDLAWYEHTLPYRTTITMGSSGVFSVDIKEVTGEYIIRTMGYRCDITINRVWIE